MRIDIVTHCHRYSRLLTYQLSSLCLFPPLESQVRATVFYCREDSSTLRVLDYFGSLQIRNVVWDWRPSPLGLLRQRAYGRNVIARSTTADLVWFTDADILFREGALDVLPHVISDVDAKLFYPRTILASRDHAEGDRTLQRASGVPRIVDINPHMFTPQRFNRAIGPMQICPSSALKPVGYCDCHRFQKPSNRWVFTSDVAFRKSLGTRGTPISVSGIYRIRHSQAGYLTSHCVHN